MAYVYRDDTYEDVAQRGGRKKGGQVYRFDDEEEEEYEEDYAYEEPIRNSRAYGRVPDGRKRKMERTAARKSMRERVTDQYDQEGSEDEEEEDVLVRLKPVKRTKKHGYDEGYYRDAQAIEKPTRKTMYEEEPRYQEAHTVRAYHREERDDDDDDYEDGELGTCITLPTLFSLFSVTPVNQTKFLSEQKSNDKVQILSSKYPPPH
mmetsp:Transcript_39097/g.51570  ORF Transcript_39097/g.51570 Transcript_39097/m.51570 type:complete len:205 (+) Transcript_39097:154-768(+)